MKKMIYINEAKLKDLIDRAYCYGLQGNSEELFNNWRTQIIEKWISKTNLSI